MAASGDIDKFYYALAEVEAGVRRYERHKPAISRQLSALSKIQSLEAFY